MLQSGREAKDCCKWLKLSCCHFLTVNRIGFYICACNQIQVCYDFDVESGWDTRPVRGVSGKPELLYKLLPQSWGPGIHLQLGGFSVNIGWILLQDFYKSTLTILTLYLPTALPNYQRNVIIMAISKAFLSHSIIHLIPFKKQSVKWIDGLNLICLCQAKDTVLI